MKTPTMTVACEADRGCRSQTLRSSESVSARNHEPKSPGMTGALQTGMNTTTNTHGPGDYAARTNTHGQTEIIRADEYHMPHIRVSWYWVGMDQCGTCSVHNSETPDQAADRAFPGSVGAKWRETRPVVWA